MFQFQHIEEIKPQLLTKRLKKEDNLCLRNYPHHLYLFNFMFVVRSYP